MEYAVFYVGTRPAVCWDWDLKEKNLDFLRGIDPQYYNHLVEAHGPYLDGDSKLQAAATLRIGYSQGLETLFALICAGMQAPDCVVGWMLSYRGPELLETVKGVSSYPPPRVYPAFKPASWDVWRSTYTHFCLGKMRKRRGFAKASPVCGRALHVISWTKELHKSSTHRSMERGRA